MRDLINYMKQFLKKNFNLQKKGGLKGESEKRGRGAFTT